MKSIVSILIAFISINAFAGLEKPVDKDVANEMIKMFPGKKMVKTTFWFRQHISTKEFHEPKNNKLPYWDLPITVGAKTDITKNRITSLSVYVKKKSSNKLKLVAKKEIGESYDYPKAGAILLRSLRIEFGECMENALYAFVETDKEIYWDYIDIAGGMCNEIQ